jgi:hemerythrin
MNHFILEEELFQRCNYPGGAAHKRLHDKFTATLMQVLTDFEAGGDIASGVLELLKDWLIQHILVADKAYAPHLAQAA